MKATESRPEANVQVRLKVAEFDQLTSQLGAHDVDDRAALIGVHRATLYRWISGTAPSLAVAMQVAKRLDAKVEDIWEDVA